MMIAAAAAAAAAFVLTSLVTDSINHVMAQEQNVTGGNATSGSLTETESLPSAGETGVCQPCCI
jgi:hypothetical protein